jgi:hypothetical protein
MANIATIEKVLQKTRIYLALNLNEHSAIERSEGGAIEMMIALKQCENDFDA